MVDEGVCKELHVQALEVLYLMLQLSLLYHKLCCFYTESIGHNVNLYNPCITNRFINEKLHTVIRRMDDLKSSYIDPKISKSSLSNRLLMGLEM